jgi:hypothetical protein
MTVRDIVMAAAGVGDTPPPATNDPQFNYVTMLLHGDGTNGAQNNTFVDSSTNNFTITRNGTPTQGSFSPYGTLWSNQFSGTQYFVLGGQSAFSFDADFTIEMWFNAAGAGTGTPKLYESRGATIEGLYVTIEQSGTSLVFRFSSAARITATFSYNTWNHVALVRSSGVITMYLNGVSAGTYSTSATTLVSASRPCIGAYPTSDNFNGYISNLRVVKGTAIYTSNFTPPTTPLTAVSGTSLLTCQSNRFIDNSSNNFAITVTGTPSVQRFSPFKPTAGYSTSVIGGSGYFNGTSQYLSAGSAGSALVFGTGDFTIEAWVYPTTIKAQRIYDGRDGSNGFFPTLGMLVGGAFTYFNNGLTRITSSTLAKANNWYHVAVCRSGTSTRLFINGIQEGNNYVDSSNYITTLSSPYIGIDGLALGTVTWAGYISDLRALKGTALYTTTFTPPTAPLTAITNTSLLLNTINAGIYDNAMMNDLVTVGDAQVSTAVVKYGTGSMKFDGTGDWLTFIDSPNVQLGTGDFTIEGWVYLSALGTARGFLSKGTSTTGFSFGVNSLNQLVFNYTATLLTATTPLVISTWYYIAVVRSGSATGNLKIYLNGSVDATSSGAVTDSFNQTSIGYVGADRVATSPMNGYIDDLRITKGYARTITTPTAAFPNN